MELFPEMEHKKPNTTIDPLEAVRIVRKALGGKSQRVAAYTNGNRVFVVIDGAKLNGRWDYLVKLGKLRGFDVVCHSQTYQEDK